LIVAPAVAAKKIFRKMGQKIQKKDEDDLTCMDKTVDLRVQGSRPSVYDRGYLQDQLMEAALAGEKQHSSLTSKKAMNTLRSFLLV
jgi:hypothetical protein